LNSARIFDQAALRQGLLIHQKQKELLEMISFEEFPD